MLSIHSDNKLNLKTDTTFVKQKQIHLTQEDNKREIRRNAHILVKN